MMPWCYDALVLWCFGTLRPPCSAISISFMSFTARFASAAIASTATDGLAERERPMSGGIPPPLAMRSLFWMLTPRFASASRGQGKREKTRSTGPMHNIERKRTNNDSGRYVSQSLAFAVGRRRHPPRAAAVAGGSDTRVISPRVWSPAAVAAASPGDLRSLPLDVLRARVEQIYEHVDPLLLRHDHLSAAARRWRSGRARKVVCMGDGEHAIGRSGEDRDPIADGLRARIECRSRERRDAGTAPCPPSPSTSISPWRSRLSPPWACAGLRVHSLALRSRFPPADLILRVDRQVGKRMRGEALDFRVD